MRLLVGPLVASLLTTGTALPVLERAGAITQSQFSDFQFYAQYAAAAYCNSGNAVGQTVSCSPGGCPTVQANGATTLATVKGGLTDIRGLVAVDPKVAAIVVSFKGTTSIANWIADLTFLQTPCDLVSDCWIHTGFLTAWRETSSTILSAVKTAHAQYPNYRIVATGHSLGGAVASLAAAYLRKAGYSVDSYTYGSPRVGNAAWGNFASTQPGGANYRITHLADPVPRLPPAAWGFQHIAPEYWLGTGGPMTTDYAISDVRVCQGSLDLACNAGTSGLDVLAHLFYLEAITACSNPFSIDAATTPTTTDNADLEAKVDAYTQMDVQYAAQQG